MAARTFTLGRYTCVERIGSTPVAELFRAKRFGLIGVERQYLVTRPLASTAKDPDALAAVATDIRLLAEHDPAGCLRIVEQSLQGADPYVVSEFPGFADLRKLRSGFSSVIEEGPEAPLWLTSLAVIFGSVAETLAGLAEHGVWHGLLSPASLWLTERGDVLLGDVGLAKGLTKQVMTAEALRPLAPWQPPDAANKTPGPGFDVFALGAMLDELLRAGTKASQESTQGAALKTVAMRAQGKSPGIATAKELAQALSALPLNRRDEIPAILGKIANQFQLSGDSVPQPITTSDRSSAEPLPPPPSAKQADSKPGPVATGRLRTSAPGDKAPTTSKAGTGKKEEGGEAAIGAAEPNAASGATEPKTAGSAQPPEPRKTDSPESLGPSSPVASAQKKPGSDAKPVPPKTPGPPPPLPAPVVSKSNPAVSVNLGAKPDPTSSATTPTADVEMAELTPAPVMTAGAPAAALRPGGAERNPGGRAEQSHDLLGASETSPAIEPVKIPKQSGSKRLGDEPTDPVSLAEVHKAAAALQQPVANPMAAGSEGFIEGDALSGTAPQPVAPVAATGTGDTALSPSTAIEPGMSPAPRPKWLLPAGGLAAVAVVGILLLLILGKKPTGKQEDPDGGTAPDGGSAVLTQRDKLPADTVQISSAEVAYVYMDGKAKGRTPLTVTVTPGAHRLIAVATGFQIADLQVTGGTKVQVPMERATLPAALAGIHSIKLTCKTTDRLRVFVDDVDTGLTCPTNDLTLSSGPHVLSFFDPELGKRLDKTVKAKVKKGKKPTKLKVKAKL